MDLHPTPFGIELSAEERSYIRRELDMVFSSLPTVAEGLQLKIWVTGPNKGQPKMAPPAKSLVERALAIVDESRHPPRLFFTKAGIAALRAMMANPRFADPAKFAHVRRELGID